MLASDFVDIAMKLIGDSYHQFSFIVSLNFTQCYPIFYITTFVIRIHITTVVLCMIFQPWTIISMLLLWKLKCTVKISSKYIKQFFSSKGDKIQIQDSALQLILALTKNSSKRVDIFLDFEVAIINIGRQSTHYIIAKNWIVILRTLLTSLHRQCCDKF